MKNLKYILFSIVLSSSTFIYTEVVEVYTWKANPGKDVELIQAFKEASVIHEKEGAVVAIEAMNVGSTQGTYQYVMRWNNATEWGKSKDKINTSPEWAAFGSKYAPGSLGVMVSSLSGGNLDQTVKATDFGDSFVYTVNVWEANPGKTQELIANFMTAKTIIEKTGARVEVYSEGTGGNGKFHYVLLYENWTKMGESYAALGSSQEWLAFQASTAQGNSGKLISSHSGSVVE